MIIDILQSSAIIFLAISIIILSKRVTEFYRRILELEYPRDRK